MRVPDWRGGLKMDEQPTFEAKTYGFLIRPDEKTVEQAVRMGRDLAPGANYRVTGEKAHITLYHAPFIHLPRQEVATMLMSLRASLRRMHCSLTSPALYGGKFLFWDILNIPTELQLAHEACLVLARYLDPNVRSRAEREGLTMLDEERKNAIEYGHPLVRRRFRPHITLAANDSGIPSSDSFWNSRDMTVETVVFAEIGEWGTPSRIIEP